MQGLQELVEELERICSALAVPWMVHDSPEVELL